MDMSHLNWAQVVGYTASLLVFSTFYMKTMIPLRCTAVVSNVAFFTYGYLAGAYPVLVLHAVLLPLNLLRLYQMYTLIERVRRAPQGDDAIAWMLPFMRQEAFNQADVLFRKGDAAETFYYIAGGTVRLPERGIVLGPGEIIGEIGIFSPFQARTTSAICETAVTALVLSHHKVLELYYQNPAFGLYLGRMIIRRLLTDVEHEKARLTAPAPHAPLGGPTPHA